MDRFSIPSGFSRDSDYFGFAPIGDLVAGSESVSSKDDIMDDYYTAVYDNSNMGSNDYSDLNVDVAGEQAVIDDIIEGVNPGVSISEYLSNNPGASAEDIYYFMAQHSDEWAEKYLDYKLEQQSLNDQNAYTASREDTAYQRLVEDLKKAGLNPALMYGSSASPSASNSLGYLRQSEGATTRSINSFTKLKNLLLGFLSYELYRKLDTTGEIFGDFKKFTSGLKDIFNVFGGLFS